MRMAVACWISMLCVLLPDRAAVAEEALVASSGQHVFVVRATEDGKGWELAPWISTRAPVSSGAFVD